MHFQAIHCRYNKSEFHAMKYNSQLLIRPHKNVDINPAPRFYELFSKNKHRYSDEKYDIIKWYWFVTRANDMNLPAFAFAGDAWDSAWATGMTHEHISLLTDMYYVIEPENKNWKFLYQFKVISMHQNVCCVIESSLCYFIYLFFWS